MIFKGLSADTPVFALMRLTLRSLSDRNQGGQSVLRRQKYRVGGG